MGLTKQRKKAENGDFKLLVLSYMHTTIYTLAHKLHF